MAHNGAPKADDVTIFVTTIGEQASLSGCMAHLSLQTVCCRIELISNVGPMSAAFQAMQDQCTTDYYVQVDDDMLLLPWAVQRLRSEIDANDESLAEVCAPLWDCDIGQPIYGVKIFRRSAVSRFPVRNVFGCERIQNAELRAAGYEVRLLPVAGREACFGQHGKDYTPRSAFRRWMRLLQKQRRFGNMGWVEQWPPLLLGRYLNSCRAVDLYAFLGAIVGIGGSLPVSESDWRDGDPEYCRLARYFPEAILEGGEASPEIYAGRSGDSPARPEHRATAVPPDRGREAVSRNQLTGDVSEDQISCDDSQPPMRHAGIGRDHGEVPV